MPIPLPPHAGQPPAPPLAGTLPARQEPLVPSDPAAEHARQAELEAALLALPRLNQLVAEHGTWMMDLDYVRPAGDLQELVALMRTAPNEFAAGLAFGMLTARVQCGRGLS